MGSLLHCCRAKGVNAMGGIVKWHNQRIHYFISNNSVYCSKREVRKYPQGLSSALRFSRDVKLVGPESFTKWLN